MRRLFVAMIGVVMFVVGAAVLWIARGPLPTEDRTTGGVLYTQEEIAASGGAAAVDDFQTDVGTVQMAPEFEAEASNDLAQVEPNETSSGPQTMAPMAAPDVPLTNNVVISEDTPVEVAPLAANAPAPAPDGQGGFTATAAGYEQRVVELEWPTTFQVGRSGAVRIKLKMLEGGALQPVAEVADNEIVATPILLTDRYNTHNAFVTATISAPDFRINSVSSARQPLTRGGEVEWRWTLEADDAQTAVISLGLSITWEPLPGVTDPGPTNVTIWGQTVQVEVNYVFGLITVPQASIAGTVLAVIGFVAQMPLLDSFLGLLMDIFFGRSRRRRRQQQQQRRRR